MLLCRQRPKHGGAGNSSSSTSRDRGVGAPLQASGAIVGTATEPYSGNNLVNRDLNDNYNQQDNQQQQTGANAAGSSGTAAAGASVVNFEVPQKQQQQTTKAPSSSAVGGPESESFGIQSSATQPNSVGSYGSIKQSSQSTGPPGQPSLAEFTQQQPAPPAGPAQQQQQQLQKYGHQPNTSQDVTGGVIPLNSGQQQQQNDLSQQQASYGQIYRQPMGQHQVYGQGNPGQTESGQKAYGQAGQQAYGQNPSGQAAYGQSNVSGQAYGQSSSGQQTYAQNPSGHQAYQVQAEVIQQNYTSSQGATTHASYEEQYSQPYGYNQQGSSQSYGQRLNQSTGYAGQQPAQQQSVDYFSQNFGQGNYAMSQNYPPSKSSGLATTAATQNGKQEYWKWNHNNSDNLTTSNLLTSNGGMGPFYGTKGLMSNSTSFFYNNGHEQTAFHHVSIISKHLWPLTICCTGRTEQQVYLLLH